MIKKEEIGDQRPEMLRKPEADLESNSGAILIRHIPFGFFEKEILKYFLQFGNVRRIRVPRNRKTGNHKGWAFVLFTDHDVAQLAAEAMDGYLMFEKRLECKVIKNKNFPSCLRRGPRIISPPLRDATRKLHAKKLNKKQSGWCEEAAKERLLKNMKIRGNKFAELGYQLPPIAGCSEAEQVMFVTNEGGPLEVEEIKSEDAEIKIQCKPFKKSKKSHCVVKRQRKKGKNVE